MKKNERIACIQNILVEQEIMTQEDLVTALLNLGIEVTQATVSRDMRELRLVKVPAQTGGYRYALPETSRTNATNSGHTVDAFYQSVIENLALQDNQLAIKTHPGSAMLLKNRLLNRFESLIFTVIADDDTVLLIGLSAKQTSTIYDELSQKM